MFVGEYAHNLDPKGRLTIPARFRAALAAGLVITRGYDPCLVIYPLAAWSALADKVAQLPIASRAARSYGRLIFGGAFETAPDKMGRVLIPSFLRDYAGIGEEAVILGINTYLEIWDPERLREALERDHQNLDTILADVGKMGV